jgi:predicted PurR-regulated permease PerM
MPPPVSSFYPRVFGSVTALVLGYAVLRITEPFLVPVLWASLLAFLLFPVNERLRSVFRGKRGPAALLLTFGSVLVVVLPAIALGIVFGRQASELVSRLQSSAAAYQIVRPSDVLELPQVTRFVAWVGSWLPIRPASRPCRRPSRSAAPCSHRCSDW